MYYEIFILRSDMRYISNFKVILISNILSKWFKSYLSYYKYILKTESIIIKIKFYIILIFY